MGVASSKQNLRRASSRSRVNQSGRRPQIQILTVMASSSNSNSNSTAIGVSSASGNRLVEWQWRTDDLSWRSYDASCNAAIEAAYARGESSVEISVDQGSTPTYLIHFQDQTPTQVNLRTQQLRMVRRHVMGQGTVSPEQVRSNESEQSSSSKDEHYSNSKDEHSYLIACPNPNDGENCSVCLNSLQEDEAIELAKCHHFFHRACITQWFKTRPSCPECLTIYGVITGTQPPGDMSIRHIPVTSQDGWDGLQGYPGIDIIEITYTIPSGIQTAEHPSPGKRYTGTRRVAYLPKDKEGEEVLELLKIAWNRRLIFTVGTSVTTGRSDTVVWAGIHHKTQKCGGSSFFGYPDETYFDRVKKELAQVNVYLN